jgi:hypothetical protein
MRDAIDAIEAALRELIEARNTLPEEFAVEIDRVITQTRVLLDSLATGATTPAEEPS